MEHLRNNRCYHGKPNSTNNLYSDCYSSQWMYSHRHQNGNRQSKANGIPYRLICNLWIGDNTHYLLQQEEHGPAAILRVATVSNAGVVTAVAAGTANFTYTATATGCASNPNRQCNS